jgi:hypothetical protein
LMSRVRSKEVVGAGGMVNVLQTLIRRLFE